MAPPLIMKADGTKYSKTESGTVWLDPNLTGPYAFYQFWINADNRDTDGYLKVFTELSRDDVALTWTGRPSSARMREAARVLTAKVTTLVRGSAEAHRAAAASQALFGQGEPRELDERTLDAAMAPARCCWSTCPRSSICW